MRDRLIASIDADDADFLDRQRLVINARSLATPPAPIELPHAEAERLLALADEALTSRRKLREEPPPQLGPVGHVYAAGVDESSGEYFVKISFVDRDTAQLAGPLLFRDVCIEEAIDTPAPANAT